MFALRLAQSMGMTLAEMGERMSSDEFSMHIALANMQAKAGQSTGDAHLEQMFGG
jgi:hypothetical protein